MFLSALHVLRHADGAEGINAFHYDHGGADWFVPPRPDEDPGVLVYEITPIRPLGGNRVRSYLGIVAPDTMRWAPIRQAFTRFVLDGFGRAFPWGQLVGHCRFEANMENALAAGWRAELGALFAAAREVLEASRVSG